MKKLVESELKTAKRIDELEQAVKEPDDQIGQTVTRLDELE